MLIVNGNQKIYVSTNPQSETSNTASSLSCIAVLKDGGDDAVIVVLGRMRLGVGAEPLRPFCARAASDS
jgi:hypothetical protein